MKTKQGHDMPPTPGQGQKVGQNALVMKRGRRQSGLSLQLRGKKGTVIYTQSIPKTVTATATIVGVKVITEVVYVFRQKTMKCEKLTRIEIR